MQIDLGDRANCVNLIPLYEKSYEEKKNDGIWLQRALNRLFNKECVDSELFVKILQQKNSLEPDASTSYYLGIIKDKEGKWFGYPTGETTTLSNLDEKEFSVQGLGVATMTHSDSSLGGPITITVNNNSTSSGGASWD